MKTTSICKLALMAVLSMAYVVSADEKDRLGEMITIPAGNFMIGNNGHEGFDGAEEFPQHSVTLPTYQIGKYEVTRGQFRKFIEDGGYQDAKYWTPEGWKWKESDVIDYAGMNGKVTHTVRANKSEKTQCTGTLGSGTRLDRPRIRPPPLYPNGYPSRHRRNIL